MTRTRPAARPTGTRARLLRAAALALALLVGALSVGTPAASAHATLERTAPAPNARLATEPRDVELVFDEPVSLALGEVNVVGPAGTSVGGNASQRGGGKIVTVALDPGAGEGSYVVSYRVMSQDSHPVSGGFFFQVGSQVGSQVGAPAGAGTGGAPLAPAVVTRAATEDGTVRAVYAVCRSAGFLGLLLLSGGVVFLVAVRTDGAARARVTRLTWLGLGLEAAASIGELVLQAPYAAGTPLAAVTAAGFDAVLHTTFGAAHLVRLALLAVVAPVLASFGARPARSPRAPAACAASLGAGLWTTWAYSGHAGVTTPGVSVPSDVLHLAAMSVWAGGLLMLALAVLPLAGAGQLRAALPRWSALAMACVAVLIISGVVQAVVEVGSWPALAQTSYGHLLLAKIALLAAVLAIANYSRRWVRRSFGSPVAGAATAVAARPEPAGAEVRRLRRAVAAESLFTVAALAVAAVLIQTTPGRASPAAPRPAAGGSGPITRHGAYVARVRRGGVVIHVKVDPAVVGVQYIYLDATRPDGRRVPVRQWTLSVSNAALGLRHVRIPVLVDSGVGHHLVYGSFTMATGGAWRVEVAARTSDVDETIVTRTVAVRS